MEDQYASEYGDLYGKHWWWRAREALVLDALGELDLPAKAEILDVGCGDGLLFPRLEQLGDVRGIEVDVDLLNPAGPYRDRIETNPLGDPGYRAWRFDLVTALDVIEHIENDDEAVAEMVRMLRPGGYLVVTVPASMSLWSHHDEINMHYRRYTAIQLERLLAPHALVLDLRYLFNALYLPKRLVTAIERLRRGDRAPLAVRQHALPPPFINSLLRQYCVWEGRRARSMRLPFGSSLLALVRRPPRETSGVVTEIGVGAAGIDAG